VPGCSVPAGDEGPAETGATRALGALDGIRSLARPSLLTQGCAHATRSDVDSVPSIAPRGRGSRSSCKS
jgi:hypothetical protein